MKYIHPSNILIFQESDERDADPEVIDALFVDLQALLDKHGFRVSGVETISIELEKYSICQC